MGGKKKETKEKPLEKMTSKELRELAFEIPEISGVHGMNKAELIVEIKTAKGIPFEKARSSGSVREIKKKIKELRIRKEAAVNDENTKMAGILKRRITKLKKKTRRFA